MRLLAAALSSVALACPVEPRDFAKPPPDEGGTSDESDGGCGTAGMCCAATCTATSACLQEDPSNCGTCGHDCLGGKCSNGKCEPSTLAQVGSNPVAIAVSDSHVFWSDNDGLKSCAKTGCTGAPGVHSTESGAAGALAFDAASANLFFASCCPGFFDSYSATGNRLSHTPVTSSIAAIGVDADYAYWNDAAAIVRATRTGASATTIAVDVPGRVRSFAFDARSRTVYAACTGVQGGIIRFPSEPRVADASFDTWTAVVKRANPSSVAIANGNLYFAVQGTGPAFSDGGVFSCPLDVACTQPTPLITGHRATAVVTSATHAYFIVDSGIHACPLSGCGGSPTLLSARSTNTPDGPVLAQDAKALYWISSTGSILKLAK